MGHDVTDADREGTCPSAAEGAAEAVGGEAGYGGLPLEQSPEPAADLTVGQLAARAGVSVSALHFFERQGLLTSTRTSGNQRRYRRDALRRVAVIRAAQRAGIPLKELAELFATLPDGRAPGRAEWAQLSGQWRDRLAARIEHLTRLRDELSDCVGCGCLSLDRCALTNPRDELGRGGTRPGSRLIWAEPR